MIATVVTSVSQALLSAPAIRVGHRAPPSQGSMTMVPVHAHSTADTLRSWHGSLASTRLIPVPGADGPGSVLGGPWRQASRSVGSAAVIARPPESASGSYPPGFNAGWPGGTDGAL